MSSYLSRTDGELVALARRGDRVARGVLVDRTLLPASRVAMHLEPDADHAVAALVAAYGDTFGRLDELEASGRFLPVLLERLDHLAPFPLDPATHAPLDPVDRDRVRRAVLGVSRTRRGAPMLAALVTVAVVALAVSAARSPTGITVQDEPAGSVGVPDSAPAPTSTTGTPSATDSTPPAATTSPTDAASPTDRADEDEAGEGVEVRDSSGSLPTELAETR